MAETVNISSPSSPTLRPSIPEVQIAPANPEPELPVPGSPAYSSSSTAEEGGSSPVLPPLPQPTINGRSLNLSGTPPSTSHSNRQSEISEQSKYFTSWGSPYQAGTEADSQEAKSESEEESPLRRLQFSNTFLRPPPSFLRSTTEQKETPISASVLANRARRGTTGLTEDWIRQHTAAEDLEIERLAWLSDKEKEEEVEGYSSLSSSEEDLEEEQYQFGQRTPTLKTFLEKKEKRAHLRERSSETITPDKSWKERKGKGRMITPSMTSNGSYETAQQSLGESKDESVFGSLSRKVSFENKPLPEAPPAPPPTEKDTKSEVKPAETWTAAALPIVTEPEAVVPSKVEAPKPPPSPAPPPPRLKTKVPWGKKNISILLPLDEDRGKTGKAPIPLTQKEVDSMFSEWTNLGYDVNGFNIDYETEVNDAASQGQSRVMWPDITDVVQERQAKNFRVSIPDKREWDAYVQELQEAKLRALGVSLGDDSPPPPPAPAPMSRTNSAQYGQPFMPPVPTASAASTSSTKQNGMFSPALPGMQGTGPSSFAGSSASVAQAMLGKLQNTRNQSVSFGSGNAFGSPFSEQQSPVAWSPQQMLYQGMHRAGSPSVNNFGSYSPNSPIVPVGQDGYFPAELAAIQHMQRQRQSSLIGQSPYLNQPLSRQSPRLQELTMDEQKTPDQQHFMQQGHRMNLSDSLQKEIEDAEYHLEEQFERQLNHDDYSPHSEKVPGQAQNIASGFGGMPVGYPDEAGVMHHPQPHSRGHSLTQGSYADDGSMLQGFDASKLEHVSEGSMMSSAIGTPMDGGHNRSQSIATNPWAEEPAATKKHATKPSLSKLNVAAKEFVFNPGKTTTELKPTAPEFKFNPASTFVPGQAAFVPPPAPTAEPQPPLSVFNTTFDPNATPVKTVTAAAKIKADAPVFTPMKSSPIVQFGSAKSSGSNEFTPGKSEFTFSPTGPSFKPKPTAPEFKPSYASDSAASGTETTPVRKSIFGNLNLLDIVKPVKKSKAIPIIRPDSLSSDGGRDTSQDRTVEDADGRLVQDGARFKRSKAGVDDGDSVPLFAEPTPEPEVMPLQETSRQSSPPKQASPEVSKPVDKENAPAEDDRLTPAPAAPKLAEQPKRASWQDAPDYGGEDWAPYEWQDQKNAKDYSMAVPPPIAPSHSASQSQSTSKLAEVVRRIMAAKPLSPSKEIEAKPAPAPVQAKKESLSALAKPFEWGSTVHETKEPEPIVAEPVLPVPVKVEEPKSGLTPSVFRAPAPEASSSVVSSPNGERKKGLAASRWAESSPSPEPEQETEVSPLDEPAAAEVNADETFVSELEEGEIREDEQPSSKAPSENAEPTFEEIDDIMRYMNEDANNGVIRQSQEVASPWRSASPQRVLRMPTIDTSPIRLQARDVMRSDAPSPTPRRFPTPPGFPSNDYYERSPINYGLSPIHHLNGGRSVEPSDWDSVLDEDDELKFNARTQFFDSHVNEIVGGILAEKLDPMERALETIQTNLALIGSSTPRRARRSQSAEVQESDADDEDDEVEHTPPRRNMSPRKQQGLNLEQIRAIVMDAFAAQQSRPGTSVSRGVASEEIINALQDLRDQIAETKLHQEGAVKEQPELANIVSTLQTLQAQVEHSMDIEFQGAKLRNIVEDVAERRINDSAASKVAELEARIAEMAQKQKITEEKLDIEVNLRREAEDRESGAKTLLRLATAEEGKLQEALEEKENRVKELEELHQESSMRAVLMEANSQNYQNQQHTLERRLQSLEKDLLEARHASKQWEFEAQKAHSLAQEEKAKAQNIEQETTNLRRTVESLKLQMQESLRVRENFRVKLGQVQERMAAASMQVNLETEQRIKKEQVLISRQEVLDARLQAEAKTRERLMNEIERLEAGERESMRAITDAKKLSIQVQKLENELHDAETSVLRYKRELESSQQASADEIERVKRTTAEELERIQNTTQATIESAQHDLHEAEIACAKYKREFEEARESGLSEVQRTRNYMQAEVEAANNQVNIVRQELEDQVLRLRAEVDNVRLESETARERQEMLLESALMESKKEINDLTKKHEDKLEDIETQHERELSNALEDAQRSEQHLLERLSLSNAKTEHLQDRVSHLEEKLEIAKAAAAAAVDAAKTARERSGTLGSAPYPSATAMPEKISPQALRETIMVLQEQLQNREQTIDSLTTQIEELDPDAQSKIQKRDDEISWLRELLAVRVADLSEIIDTLSKRTFDPEDVRAAAIRLKANLQMEEQERERALNGGSAITLPNIANSIREAATPRVAQVVGPMAAAWGNWRKNQATGGERSASPSIMGEAQSFIAGFMTPPMSRNVSSTAQPSRAVQRTGTRRQISDVSAASSFATPKQRTQTSLAREAARERPSPRKEMNRARSRGRGRMGSDASMVSQSTVHGGVSIAPSYSQGSASLRSVDMPDMRTPSTPPMMHRGSYDADARQEDYSDAGFYDDDESTVDESMFGANLGR